MLDMNAHGEMENIKITSAVVGFLRKAYLNAWCGTHRVNTINISDDYDDDDDDDSNNKQ